MFKHRDPVLSLTTARSSQYSGSPTTGMASSLFVTPNEMEQDSYGKLFQTEFLFISSHLLVPIAMMLITFDID